MRRFCLWPTADLTVELGEKTDLFTPRPDCSPVLSFCRGMGVSRVTKFHWVFCPYLAEDLGKSSLPYLRTLCPSVFLRRFVVLSTHLA